ncbi:hypothetical protein FLL57_02740 [Rhodopseudomonas palustris]|nr:hypothetical protein FLL57_02740 [Rhodopseudomonas palustris]
MISHSINDEFRHGRACPGHPRLSCCVRCKAWMPGTRPGMTAWTKVLDFTARFSGRALRRTPSQACAVTTSPSADPAPASNSTNRSRPARLAA